MIGLVLLVPLAPEPAHGEHASRDELGRFR